VWRPWVLVAVALSSSGCLDNLSDAIRGDDYVIQELIEGEQTVAFAYENVFDPAEPPETPDQAYERRTITFTLDAGTRLLTVTYEIVFDDASAGIPLPPDLHHVRVSLIDPAGEAVQTAVATSDQGNEWEVLQPVEGDWAIRLEARASGEATFTANALVPD
jgi:hypothetical protein